MYCNAKTIFQDAILHSAWFNIKEFAVKVYIQTDIEGVAGFCFFENRKNSDAECIKYRYRMYQLLTDEVNAAVKACFDAGANEVLVNDNHGSGYNILFEQLDERCQIIHGRSCTGKDWLEFFDETFDALVIIGAHAMAETPCAITPHSKWCVNGGEIFLSEASMAAALAGDKNIPTVMVSGDDKVGAELLAKMPDLEFAQVKRAVSPYLACSMIPSAACKLIYQKVRAGVEKRNEIKPYKINGPVSLVLFDSDNHAPPLKACGKEVSAPTISEAFSAYLRNLPWYTLDLRYVDGYQFPAEKSRP